MLILNIILIIIALLLYREFIIYTRIQFYRKQGVKLIRYSPFFSNLIKFNKNRSKGKDAYGEQRERYGNIPKGEHLYVSNNYIRPCCNIIPVSNEAVRDFFKVETLYTKKSNVFKTFNFLGFFFQNGKSVEMARGIFGKIFHIENVKRFLPAIQDIVRIHVRKLKKVIEEKKEDVYFLDIKKEIWFQMFDDISNAVLLGAGNEKNLEKFEGMNVTEIVKNMFYNYFKFSLNPLNALTFGLGEKLNLFKEVREIKKLKQGLKNILKKEYIKRENEIKKNLDSSCNNNALDIAIDRNLRIEMKQQGYEDQEKLSLDDITNYLELFKLAASDTSFHGSSSLLTLLSLKKNQEYQEKIRKSVDKWFERLKGEDYTFDDIDGFEYLDCVVKESMRIIPPAPTIGSRKVIKDFKLQGINIKKGDSIVIFFLAMMMNKNIFGDPTEFRPERFMGEEKKKIPYYNNIPFSSGKRACLGQTLGELLMKVVTVEFLRVFEFSVSEGYEMKLSLEPVYGVKNCNLGVKIR